MNAADPKHARPYDSNGVAESPPRGRNVFENLSRTAAGSGRKRATIFGVAWALLLIAAWAIGERTSVIVSGLLVAPGAILFLAGGFTAVFGQNAAQKKGLGWSLLRIGFGLILLLILFVGAALLIRATR